MTFSEPTTSGKPASTVLVGSPGPLSASVFNTLISNGITIPHVVYAGIAPATPVEGALPVARAEQDDTLDVLANRFHIPVSYVSRSSELLSSSLQQHEKADYVLVACFPFRLPDPMIRWPRVACLNIHPSLLPKYRGPDPIFWQLKKGESQTGVSLHIMTEDFDTGPVVKQKTVAYEEGAYKKDIEILLGQEGAILFARFISEDLPINEISSAQDDTASSYYHKPSVADYQLSPGWSAQQAFNFIRGTWPPLDQFTITIGETTWIINQALEYSSKGELPEPVQVNKDELYIQFSPGILRTLAHKA